MKNNNIKSVCHDITKCDNAIKYKAEGKAYCLVCSKSLVMDNEKKASATKDNMFKHASEDL